MSYPNTSISTVERNTSLGHDSYSHGLNPVFSVFITMYFIIIIISAIIFNLVLILTVVYKRKLHTVTNILVVNLAVGDLFTAILVVTFDVDFFIRGYFPDNYVACGFREVSFMLSLPTSVVSLLLLTCERFVSVNFPFKRICYFTKKNTYMLIVLSWCYTFLVAIFPIMSDIKSIYVAEGVCGMAFPMEYIIFQLFANFLIPISVICCMNIYLFRVASRHAIDIRTKSLIDGCHVKKVRPSMISFGVNLKAAKTILLLVGIFLLCWLPFIVMAIHNTLCHVCHPREVTWIGNGVNYASIFINPLLYGLRNKEIRKELRKLAATFVDSYCDCVRLSSDRSHSNFCESVSGEEQRSFQRSRSSNREDEMIQDIQT